MAALFFGGSARPCSACSNLDRGALPCRADATGDRSLVEAELRHTLDEWARAVGADRVMPRQEAEARYGGSTVGLASDIPAAVRPRSEADVRAVVEIAQRNGVALHPISTGRNWGYGSANPVTPACVVDLSDMRRIIDMDAELGLVTLEPGVTQAMLRAFLDEHGLPFMVPVTGAGPTCSLLGNALERGFGITPHCDHFGAVTSLQAVLGDGRLYRSPLAELGAGDIDRGHKWGIGPYLDGLFAQGAFGIVTRMTIALARRPEAFCAFFLGARQDRSLEGLVVAVRQVLRATAGSTGFVNLMNAQRMLAMVEPFPAQAAADGVIPEAEIARLSRRNGIMPWNGVGAIYGSREVVRATRRTVRRLLGPRTDRLIFVTPQRLGWARRLSRPLPGRFRRQAERLVHTLQDSIDIMQGMPREVALPLAYWRSGRRPDGDAPMNPARDGCGLIWFAPLVAMRPDSVRTYVETLTRVCQEHGMNPLITLTTLSDRCFDSTVPLLFDRSCERERVRAEACYDALFQEGRRMGFVPYRVGVNAMPTLTGVGEFWETVARLKRATDPRGIISPGRYTRP